MAFYQAIAAVGKAILRRIADSCPTTEFVGVAPSFDLYGPEQFATPMAEGFSLSLLRVSANSSMRNSFPRRDESGQRLRPSLPIDLQFLLTPWAAQPERQLRLLGWAMRHMEDEPILSSTRLNDALTDKSEPVFFPEEAVEILFDPLGLSDHLSVWDRLKPKLPPSLYYTVRAVRLDSKVQASEYPPVAVRETTLLPFSSGSAP